MWKWIDYLKDPYLVLEVQKFFGVYPVIDKNLKKQFKNSSNGNVVQSRKKDNNSAITNSGSLNKNSDDTESAITSGSDTETKDYVVTNKFWYYLFVFGTELGDEIFYASFIPFWFWNIDGAVGRRVVMVWTLIMCIGKCYFKFYQYYNLLDSILPFSSYLFEFGSGFCVVKKKKLPYIFCLVAFLYNNLLLLTCCWIPRHTNFFCPFRISGY